MNGQEKAENIDFQLSAMAADTVVPTRTILLSFLSFLDYAVRHPADYFGGAAFRPEKSGSGCCNLLHVYASYSDCRQV